MMNTFLQVSNEVIRRCSTKISLDNIFDGNVKESVKGLKESIASCVSWKETYQQVGRVDLVDMDPFINLGFFTGCMADLKNLKNSSFWQKP